MKSHSVWRSRPYTPRPQNVWVTLIYITVWERIYVHLLFGNQPQCNLFKSLLCNIYSEDTLCGCGKAKNGTLALEKLKSWVNSSPELGQTFIKMIFAQVKNTYFLPSFQVSSSTFRPGVCFHHLLSIFQDYSQDVIGFSIFLMKTVEWLGTQTLNEPHCKRSTFYRSYFSKGDL